MSDPALQAGVYRLGTDDEVFTMILELFTVCVGSCVAGWSSQTGDELRRVHDDPGVVHGLCRSCVAGWSSQTGDRRRRVHDDPGVPFRAPPVCRVPGLPGQVRPADGVSDRGRDERRHQAGLPSYRSDPLCPTGVVSLRLISSSLSGNIVYSQLRWADTRQA